MVRIVQIQVADNYAKRPVAATPKNRFDLTKIVKRTQRIARTCLFLEKLIKSGHIRPILVTFILFSRRVSPPQEQAHPSLESKTVVGL